MKRTCLFSGEPLDDSTIPEHLLPDFLGGTFTSMLVTSTRFNQEVSGPLEHRMAPNFQLLTSLADGLSGRSSSRRHSYRGPEGERMTLEAGIHPRLDGIRVLERDGTEIAVQFDKDTPQDALLRQFRGFEFTPIASSSPLRVEEVQTCVDFHTAEWTRFFSMTALEIIDGAGVEGHVPFVEDLARMPELESARRYVWTGELDAWPLASQVVLAPGRITRDLREVSRGHSVPHVYSADDWREGLVHRVLVEFRQGVGVFAVFSLFGVDAFWVVLSRCWVRDSISLLASFSLHKGDPGHPRYSLRTVAPHNVFSDDEYSRRQDHSRLDEYLDRWLSLRARHVSKLKTQEILQNREFAGFIQEAAAQAGGSAESAVTACEQVLRPMFRRGQQVEAWDANWPDMKKHAVRQVCSGLPLEGVFALLLRQCSCDIGPLFQVRADRRGGGGNERGRTE